MDVIENAFKILKAREFIILATANKKGRPNAAPKLLLKIEGRIVYFIDYSVGKTADNLKINPEVSLSFIDTHSLLGYRLNGKVEVIEKGKVYAQCLKEVREKELKLSVERIIQGVRRGKASKVFELDSPEHFLIYKVKIEDGCEISPRGVIKREN